MGELWIHHKRDGGGAGGGGGGQAQFLIGLLDPYEFLPLFNKPHFQLWRPFTEGPSVRGQGTIMIDTGCV